jgi:DNA-directed RNA polymerase subunit omega
MKKVITHDELLAKEPNKYRLAIVRGKRMAQLIAGDEPKVKVRKKDTLLEIASRELVEGKIKLVKVEE